MELPHTDAARREAMASAGDMVVGAVGGNDVIDQRTIEVASGSGTFVDADGSLFQHIVCSFQHRQGN
jgi:hypothetical protein